MIERLGEPLTHLIRNAVDHGIESAEERLAAGKSAEGTLTLSAEHRSGRILIRIADDGAGIDRARVLGQGSRKGHRRRRCATDQGRDRQPDLRPGLLHRRHRHQRLRPRRRHGRGAPEREGSGRAHHDRIRGRQGHDLHADPAADAGDLGRHDRQCRRSDAGRAARPMSSKACAPKPSDVQGLGAPRQMLNVRGRFIPVLPVGQAVGARGCLRDAERRRADRRRYRRRPARPRCWSTISATSASSSSRASIPITARSKAWPGRPSSAMARLR